MYSVNSIKLESIPIYWSIYATYSALRLGMGVSYFGILTPSKDQTSSSFFMPIKHTPEHIDWGQEKPQNKSPRGSTAGLGVWHACIYNYSTNK